MQYKLFIITALIHVTAYGQNEVSYARYAKDSVVVNGHSDEWQKPFNFYDSNTGFYFSISNNAQYLFLCFETSNPMNQLKIIKTGLSVSLSTKGKNKKNTIINFPLPDKNLAANHPAGNMDMLTLRTDFFLNQTEAQTLGFSSVNGTILLNNDKISIGANWDKENNMVFEYKISLKEIFGNDFDFKSNKEQVQLKAEINGLPKKNIANMNSKAMSGRTIVNNGQQNLNANQGVMGTNTMGNPMAQQMQPLATDNSDNENTDADAERGFLYEKAELKQKFLLNTDF